MCWVLISWLCLRGKNTRLATAKERELFATAVALGAVLICVLAIRTTQSESTYTLHYQERNFFGVLRVGEFNRESPEHHQMILRHGTTIHGSQNLNPKFRDFPTSYYSRFTGIGFVMRERPTTRIKVGVIGLGAGTLATYGRSGDEFRFYEIDPNVIQVARNEDYFSFLADTKSNVEIILGDGRLSLENELKGGKGQEFNLLVLDAFSSDAIPVHLVTVEAFDLYTRHLAPKGVIAVHISNVSVDLAPLVFRLAAEFYLHAVKIVNQGPRLRFHADSDWMILSHDAEFINRFPKLLNKSRSEFGFKPTDLYGLYPKPDAIALAPRWTDDYSDLLSVLKD
jgi:hypothetical protein